jgi:crotonobetainyl-CoA:carnitine CoA-transferase CaiB-like acyl-CoA transferase
MLQAIFSTKTRDDWLEFLRAADIPCAASGTVEEYLNDPQVIANNMVVEIEQPSIGLVRQMGIPVRLYDNLGEIKGPAPEPGEHTTEILSNLGYTAQDIIELINKRVV